MNITTEQLWAGAKRLRDFPALLDVAGAFVLLYAKALQTNPGRAKTFLLSLRPMGGFKNYIDCLHMVISEMPTLKRHPYEQVDVLIAILLHGKIQRLTVPYIDALDDVVEWMAPEFSWVACADTSDDFMARISKYWGIARARRATVQEVATAVGVSRATLYHWLDGTTVPPMSKMSAYTKAFHEYIIKLTGQDPDK